MKYSYYPGCTLKNKARDLDAYARASAEALGFEMEEIEDWQCCGGVYPLGSDEIATKLASIRALQAAKEKGQELITVCSACHHEACGGYSDQSQQLSEAGRALQGRDQCAPLSGSTP